MENWLSILLLCGLALYGMVQAREPFTIQPHRRQLVRGPEFNGKGPEVVIGTDSYKTNVYPQLLGGHGNISTRIEGAGVTTPSKNWLLVADGSLPSSASLGSDENSKYLPFSRVETDLEDVPDAFKVSRHSIPSLKTEPSPFLTDFSAFFR